MSRYGRVDVLWYDGLGGSASTYDAAALNSLARSLQPALLINNRNGGLAEDFDTPEQKVGTFNNTRAWESCMTISAHNHWAWGGASDGVKSLSTCINHAGELRRGRRQHAAQCRPAPRWEASTRNRLAASRKWATGSRQYGQSIYGTRGGPFKPAAYGASTYQANTVYVHVLSWVQTGWCCPRFQPAS